MKITLEIPKEFEVEYLNDKFRDTLARLSADAHCVAGNYEKLKLNYNDLCQVVEEITDIIGQARECDIL